MVDAASLEELFRAHAVEATRVAYLLTTDRALADDLVQDAFVRLAGRALPVSDDQAVRAYLRRMLVNAAISEGRSATRRQLRETRAAESASAVAPGVAVEDGLDLWAALQALPARQRAALVLRFYEDLSEAETAKALRCRPGTVKSLVARGLEAIRASLAGATDA